MADHPEITITVAGAVGIGKSAVALTILDALRLAGLTATWEDEASERNMGAGADDVAALGPKPHVRLVEVIGALPDFDLVAHLKRQREWSARTFGPGDRTAGVLDHIRKELLEVEADPGDVTEWVDLVILAMDGAWRAGHEPAAIVQALVAKQAKNEGRTWPDWRTAEPGKAIEHDRSGEVEALPELSSLPRIEAPVDPTPQWKTGGAWEIALERRRQITAKGFHPADDVRYTDDELVHAARSYLVAVTEGDSGSPPETWPWVGAWWKPADRRRNLVRAGALIAAELDRMDREATDPSVPL